MDFGIPFLMLILKKWNCKYETEMTYQNKGLFTPTWILGMEIQYDFQIWFVCSHQAICL